MMLVMQATMMQLHTTATTSLWSYVRVLRFISSGNVWSGLLDTEDPLSSSEWLSAIHSIVGNCHENTFS